MHTSDPQEKLPESSRKALNLRLPPRTRTGRVVTLVVDSLVLAGCLPISYLEFRSFSATTLCTIRTCSKAAPIKRDLSCCAAYAHFLFLRHLGCFPPVRRRL